MGQENARCTAVLPIMFGCEEQLDLDFAELAAWI